MITHRFSNEVRQNKDGDRTVAIINSGALDRHGTVIDPKGIDLTAYSRNPVFLINHDYDRLAGNGAVIRYQDDKLIAEVPDEAWDHEDEDVMKWFRKVKNGKMRMTSIGFTYDSKDVEEEERTVDGEVVKVPVIRKSELLEFSFVTVGSNPEALIMEREFSVKDYFEKRFNELEAKLKGMADRDYINALIEEHFENYLPKIRQPEPKKEPKPEQSVDRSALIAQEAARQILEIKKQRGQR